MNPKLQAFLDATGEVPEPTCGDPDHCLLEFVPWVDSYAEAYADLARLVREKMAGAGDLAALRHDKAAEIVGEIVGTWRDLNAQSEGAVFTLALCGAKIHERGKGLKAAGKERK